MQINDEEAQVKLIKKDEGEGCGPWTQFTVEEKSRNFARKKKVQKREPQHVAMTVAMAYVSPSSIQRWRELQLLLPKVIVLTPHSMEGLFFNVNGGLVNVQQL